MSIATLIISALKFIFPAYCANATPVLAGGGTKMDFGKNFIDGKRVFGNNKTFKGFFFGLAVGIFVGLLEVMFFHFPLLFSILTPIGALLGDLFGAFIKRRLGINPGGCFPSWIKLTSWLARWFFRFPLALVSWELALTVLLITPPIHLFTNFVAFKLG